jgi:hypothetical protein
MGHSDRYNILYKMQHGFRRKFISCEIQLIEFIDDVTKYLDNGQQTDCLITDFSKAFDKVGHSVALFCSICRSRKQVYSLLDQTFFLF